MFESSCNRTLSDLSVQEIGMIEEQLQGKRFSQCSMLAADESLSEVIQADRQTLAGLNLSNVQIVQAIEALIYKYSRKCSILQDYMDVAPEVSVRVKAKHQADKALWQHMIDQSYQMSYPNCKKQIDAEFILIDDRFLMTRQSFGGAQTCPFQCPEDKRYHGYQYGSTDYYIHNLVTNESIWFNTLVPHMILQHEFCEGQVFHRVDPEKLVRVLEIQANVDYLATLNEYACWQEGQSHTGINVVIEPDMVHWNKDSANYQAAVELYQADGPTIQYGIIDNKLNLIVTQNKVDVDIVVDGLPLMKEECYRGWYVYTKKTYKYIPLAEELML